MTRLRSEKPLSVVMISAFVLSLWTPLTSVAVAAEPEAPTAERTRVVVYRLTSDSAAPSEDVANAATQLSETVLLHLGKRPELIVLGEAEIKLMMQHEADKAALLCDDSQRCLSKLRDAVQAEKLVTGTVGRMGTSWIATLKLTDTQSRAIVAAESAQGDDVATLAAEVEKAADRLFGAPAEGSRFALTLGPDGTKAAVLDLAALGVEPGLAKNLSELLALELKRFEGLSVISRDEIAAMLRLESDKQILQCTSDTSCLVQIGGALGVDYLVAGSVGKLGETYVITLKLMDVNDATVVNRASQSLQGEERELAVALRFATWELLGRPLAGNGSIMVRANVDEGELTLAGGEPEPWSGKKLIAGVPVGRYGLTLRAEGYRARFQETFVQDGTTTNLRLELPEIPVPWYDRWYVWAVVGGVVAAGVTTAVVLAPSGDPGTKVSVTVR